MHFGGGGGNNNSNSNSSKHFCVYLRLVVVILVGSVVRQSCGVGAFRLDRLQQQHQELDDTPMMAHQPNPPAWTIISHSGPSAAADSTHPAPPRHSRTSSSSIKRGSDSVSGGGRCRFRHHHHHRSRHRRRQLAGCQEQDVSRRAYLANAVVVARAESMSTDRRDNYTVLFKVVQRIKNSTAFPVADYLPLQFSAAPDATSSSSPPPKRHCQVLNCDSTQAPSGGGGGVQLVRARIDRAKEYILFLNAFGRHNYSVIGAPEPRRRRIPNTILRVVSPVFRPKEVRVEYLERIHQEERRKHPGHNRRVNRLKLMCQVRGFPVPYISWRQNGTTITPTFSSTTSHIRITFKKRKSTLVVRNPVASDWGLYECVANGVDGSKSSRQIIVNGGRSADQGWHLPPPTKPPSTLSSATIASTGLHCIEEMKANYCLNGGTCFYMPSLREYACVCAEGYSGSRCVEKSSNQSSEHEERISDMFL